MSIEIKITEEYNGVKPKNFLKKKVDLPFFQIVKMIPEKRITLNGKKIKKDDVMKTGDIIKIWPHDIKLREIEKQFKNSKDLGIKTIFENKDLLVLNKTAGITVQGSQEQDMSLSMHLAYLQEKSKDEQDFEYFHVHRLDKDTSGCLIIAKNRNTLRDFNELFRTREMTKKYVCLCVGELPKEEGTIEIGLRRTDEGVREKMEFCDINDRSGKKSLSLYKLIEEIEYDDEVFSLVEVEIKTGITHQIRMHMKHLGCPILGDKMYGNSSVNRQFERQIKRQFLHCKYLGFNYKDEEFKINAPLTSDLKSFLDEIKEN